MSCAIFRKALLCCLCLMILAVPAAASTIYLPQIAVGTAGDLQVQTLLTVSNPTTNQKNITVPLYTFHDDGSEWVVDWEARDRPDLSGPRSNLSVSLLPGQTVTMLAKSTGAITTGWMSGRSNFPALVTLRYSVARVTGSVTDPQWEVGVLPAVGLNEHFLFVAEGASDWSGCTTSTALAIANTSWEGATVTLELFPYAGISPTHTRTLTLPSNGHLAQFLPEIFDNVFSAAAFRGMLRISSNTPVAVITLQNWATGPDSVFAAAGALPLKEAMTNISFDQEPSNTPGEGEYVRAPAELVGVLSSSSDSAETDFFKLYVDKVGTLAVVSLADVLGSALTPEVALLDGGNQTVLATATSILPGFGASAFQVAIPQEGWYWLRVSSPSSAYGRRHLYRIFVGLK